MPKNRNFHKIEQFCLFNKNIQKDVKNENRQERDNFVTVSCLSLSNSPIILPNSDLSLQSRQKHV